MHADNVLCFNCQSSAPHVFCACTTPETVLCDSCMSKHVRNNPRVPHSTQPLDQLPYYKISGYYDRLQVREEAFPKVKVQALKSVEDIDRAVKDYTAQVEKFIWELIAHSQKVITELKETQAMLRSEVQSALEEVQRTLKEDKPQLSTRFGAALRDLAQIPRTFQLFSYSLKATASPQSLVPLQTQLAAPQDLFIPVKFAGVFKDKAFLYDVVSQRITQHTLSVNFDSGGSFVEVDKSRLLCVGARPASSAVYLLDLSSF